MPTTTLTDTELTVLKNDIVAWCRELGFQYAGIADIDLAAAEDRLSRWLSDEFHGSMDYMARHGSKRSRPAELVPGTVRVICVRMDYLVEPQQAARTNSIRRRAPISHVMRWGATITRCCDND